MTTIHSLWIKCRVQQKKVLRNGSGCDLIRAPIQPESTVTLQVGEREEAANVKKDIGAATRRRKKPKAHSEAASALAKVRWSKATKEDREKQGEIARHAGRARLKKRNGN